MKYRSIRKLATNTLYIKDSSTRILAGNFLEPSTQ